MRSEHGRRPYRIERSRQWAQRTPRRVRKEARASPSPLPVPRVARWRALTVAALLLLLAGLHARGSPPATLAWWQAAPVVRTLDGLAAVLSGAQVPTGARLGLLALAVLAAGSWRQWRRALLAYLPGPVDVHGFTNATGDPGAPTDDVRSRFCGHLSRIQIYPPYAGPADPPPQSFLDVTAERGPNGPTHPLALAAQALPRLVPRVGYLVTGTLHLRTQEPRHGISVTVTSFVAGGRSAMTTQWGRSWDDVTCQAAYWVLATILPVTRLARTAPWGRWRGRELPWDLFEAYNEGKQRQDERRLDEALWWYAKALRHDPFNADLRLMVASVQEDLGLFLDALDTYQGALNLGELSGRYCDHIWTTRGYRLRHPWRHIVGNIVYMVRRRESIKLRYQYACTLAYGERTVGQWFGNHATGEREKVLLQMRERLRDAFVDRYWPVAVAYAERPDEIAAKRWLRRALRESPAATKLIFQLAAAHELYRLREDLTLARLIPGTRSAANRTVLRLARDVWAPLRLAKALDEWRDQGWRDACLGGRAGPPAPFDPDGALRPWWRRAVRRRAAALIATWPPTADQLERAIGRAQRRWLRWPHLNSYDYYSAACVYGFSLYGYPEPVRADDDADPAGEYQTRKLSYQAVEQLRASLACTESGVAARLRSWIVSSDPDLAPLRNQPEFRHFERDEYPSLKLFFPRPDKVINVRMSAYTKQLICDGAALLEQTWRDRAATAGRLGTRVLMDWLELDARLWEVLAAVARDRARYWRDRAEFITLVKEVVDPVRLAEADFPPWVPGFDDVVMDGSAELAWDELRSAGPIERLSRQRIGLLDAKLVTLESRVARQASGASLLDKAMLAEFDPRGEALRANRAADICARRAARWRRAADHIDQTGITMTPGVPPDAQLRP